MVSLKFQLGPACLTLLLPTGEPPLDSLTDVSGVAHPQDGRPTVIFYLFGHPMPYAYATFPVGKLFSFIAPQGPNAMPGFCPIFFKWENLCMLGHMAWGILQGNKTASGCPPCRRSSLKRR
jgi:hypothetical protein